nr:PH23-36 [Vibrio phage 1]
MAAHVDSFDRGLCLLHCLPACAFADQIIVCGNASHD